jgi:hypothetical protein
VEVSNISVWQVSFDHFFDVLRSRKCNDKVLPCNRINQSFCIEEQDAQTVFKIGNWETNYLVNDSEVVRVAVGGLLSEIWNQIDPNNTNGTLFSEFSAHDGTLLFLLSSLGALDGEWPPYSSHLIFETYVSVDDSSSSFILTKYNAKEIYVKGCSQIFCSHWEFYNSISQFFWNDFYTECL